MSVETGVVVGAEPGVRRGAFFDLEKTMTPDAVEQVTALAFYRQGELSLLDVLTVAWIYLRYDLGLLGDLESMKHLKQAGPKADLDLDETIRQTARNGGEIDLVFRRDLRDRIRVILLIDNGGYSMTPFVDLTRLSPETIGGLRALDLNHSSS